jgi:hypothetical protein
VRSLADTRPDAGPEVAMSNTRRQRFDDTSTGAWAAGLAIFAGVLLSTLGLFQVIAGLTAVVNDNVYVTTVNYVFELDLTAWGWIHLLVGVLAAATGIALLFDQNWARVVGIGFAVLSMLTNFAFIPYYPFWSLVIIALGVAVVWALAIQLSRR